MTEVNIEAVDAGAIDEIEPSFPDYQETTAGFAKHSAKN